MRIRTMLISSIVAAIFLSGILVVASFVVSNQNTELALSKKRAQFVAQRVSNLLILTYEYSNTPYQRIIDQWRGAHATVVDVLTSEEKNAIPEIEEALIQAKALADNFDTLVSFKAVGKRLEDEQKTLLFNLLVADTQSLSDLIYRWENTITKNVELSDSRFHKFAVIVPTLALLMAIFFASLLFRRVMHPMAMLLDKVRATARGEITTRASAVSADEFGELAHAFDSMAVDLVNSLKKEIDERKVAERQSAESEFRLRTIVENEPECVKVTDAQGNLLQMNPSGLILIGADSLEQVVGHSVLDLVLPDCHDAYLNFHQKVLAGETKNLEFQILNLKGVSRWVESTATPIDYKGERVILAVTRDITARKQADALLENHRQNLELLIKERTAELENAKLIAEAANIAKSAFLSNMSHEIRTPLNAITGMAHLIKRSGVTSEQFDRLEKIDVAGRHLLEIINSILDLSKIEAGKFELQEVALNLSELIANLVSIISDRVKEKNLELEVVVQPVSCNLIGDPTRIQQALLNYATNAIKFTSNGKISLRATVLDEDHDSVLFRFEIQDTGIGISSDVLPKLFSSFEQADNSIARKYGGTGLGLAINKKLAQLMGGDAGATSTLGMGSIFWFTARLKKTESSIVHVSKDALLSAETSLSRSYTGYRILLAEDEPINREITLELLSDLGLVVDVAEDGLKAFDFAMKNKYHLILMDMQMPNMDGLEATRQIRKLPNGKDVPVLAMTANAFDDDKRRCFDAGMNDFITKPVVPEMFFNTLLNWLSRSPMH